MENDSKVVVGSYRNPEDVIAAIQRLKREGYAKEDITLYTEQSNFDRLGDTEGIDTATDVPSRGEGKHKSDRSFWEKIKDMVSYDTHDEYDSDDRPDDLLTPYRQDIRDGYTVIAVDNYISDTEKEMDTTPIDTTDDQEMKLTDRDPSTPVTDSLDHTERTDPSESEIIQLKEERLHVNKEEVQTGEVNIRKETVYDTEIIEVPVKREQIVVERKSVGEGKTVGSDSNLNGDSESYTIPIKEEIITIKKEPVVTEEVEIKKERKEDIKQVTEDVRREEIDIDSTGRTGIEGREDDPDLRRFTDKH